MSISKHYERVWQNKDCEILYSCLSDEITKRAWQLDLDMNEVVKVLTILMKEHQFVADLESHGIKLEMSSDFAND